METNFFSQMSHLDVAGSLQLTIAKGVENNLIVSVLLQNEHCGDDAKKLIPPYNLRGTAEELDNGFFDKITVPIQTASGLMVDMEAFMKQLEEAKKQSAMEKEKADKAKSEKDAKDKKYKEAMAKVDELDKAEKPKEAWMKLPGTKDFPEHAETIRKRRSELSARFAPDLFGNVPTEEQQTNDASSHKEELFSQSEEMEFDDVEDDEY